MRWEEGVTAMWMSDRGSGPPPKAAPSWIAPSQSAMRCVPPFAAESEPLIALESGAHEVAISPAPMPEPPAPRAPSMRAIQIRDLTEECTALRAENEALRARLTEMESIEERVRREIFDASESELVRLAIAIAERVVRRELHIDPKLLASWVREAIDALANKDTVVLATAPDVSEDAFASLDVSHRVEVKDDLAPGAIEVHGGGGFVEVSVESRVAAVKADLGLSSE